MFGGAAVVSLRAAVGVAANELQLFPEAGLAWWRLPFVDVGLPSLVHGWLTAIASGVGGVALITVAHVLLYGALVGLWLRAAREVAGPRTAWAVTAALAASPTLLYQVTELRSYATFLTCCGVALLALTRRPARVDLAALALVVGALDAPSCLLLLAGVFVARLFTLPLPQRGPAARGGSRSPTPRWRWGSRERPAGAWTAAVLLPGAAHGAWLWFAGAAGGALIGAAWPSAPPLVPVLVLLVTSGGAVRARVGREQEERAAREAALALAKEEAAGSAICAPEAHVAAWLRAAELSAARVDPWSPLRAAEAGPPLQEGCEGAAVVVVSRPERLPPGCAEVSDAGWQIGRCAR